MKNLIVLLVMAAIVGTQYSCDNANAEENANDKQNTEIVMDNNETNEVVTTKNEKDMEAEVKIENKGKVVHLSTQEFKEKVFNYETNKDWKYLGDKPCIIDFYADWCRPCKMVAPILDELAKEYKDDIVIYKVDTEKERELAATFGIRSIPSILFVPVGEQPQMAQGAMPKDSFKEVINNVLLKK